MSKHVGILVGGPGPEAEVSLCSGKFAYENFPTDFASPFFIHIDEDLCFSLHGDPEFMEGSGNLYSAKKGIQAHPMSEFCSELRKFGIERENLAGIFPLVHGVLGEDGSILSFLEILNFPYAGCSARTSMLCFDKVLTKLALLTSGIEVVPFIWGTTPEAILQHPFGDNPVYVKPARQGSSIGVHRVENHCEYEGAVQDAFHFDTKVLIEPEIPGRELEVAVLQKGEEWIISRAGEVKSGSSGYYSFEAKYSLESDALASVANLQPSIQNSLREQVLNIIKTLELRGFARLDFFLDANDKIWLNEINTLPGFTGISMFPLLLEEDGLSAQEMIRVILEGMETNGTWG